MRTALLLLAAALPLLGGCSSECGTPDQFNNFTYRVFSNPVSFEVTNDALTAGPDYWSYGIPANGPAEWQFRWGVLANGPVTVVINGQEFEGTGAADEVECGLSTVDFSGTYFDSLSEVEHTFNASLSLSLWTDAAGAGQLGGYLIWKESWTHPSSESGTFTADSHMTGELIGQGGGTPGTGS